MVDQLLQKLQDFQVGFDFVYFFGYFLFGRSWIKILKQPGMKVSDVLSIKCHMLMRLCS